MTVTIDGSAGVTTNSGAVYNGLQIATAVASTSGTSIDFTSIPSWVKRITVMLSGVSTSGTSNLFMRVGYGATPTYLTSGYTYNNSDPGGSASSTTGCILNGSTAVTAATLFSGQIVILVQDASSGSIVISSSTANVSRSISGTGRVTIPTAFVSAIRITTEGGADTFDAGSINIIYE